MGQDCINGELIRFELEHAPWLRRLSEIFRLDIWSTKTTNHAKAWLPTDQQGGWVTYEVTTGMTESDEVTLLATNDQQKKGYGPMGLQLVKIVGRGKAKNVRLCGSTGAKQLGKTKFQRLGNSDVDGKMRSIKEIEEHAR